MLWLLWLRGRGVVKGEYGFGGGVVEEGRDGGRLWMHVLLKHS